MPRRPLAAVGVAGLLGATRQLEAFSGISPRPRFADFFYHAVLTAYLSSFVDWHRSPSVGEDLG